MLNQTNSILAIKIKDNQNGVITQTPVSIDRCCKPFVAEPNTSNISTIIDDIPRAPCNMSKEEFLFNYVERRKAVILRGCQEEWPALNWTFEGIFCIRHDHICCKF